MLVLIYLYSTCIKRQELLLGARTTSTVGRAERTRARAPERFRSFRARGSHRRRCRRRQATVSRDREPGAVTPSSQGLAQTDQTGRVLGRTACVVHVRPCDR